MVLYRHGQKHTAPFSVFVRGIDVSSIGWRIAWLFCQSDNITPNELSVWDQYSSPKFPCTACGTYGGCGGGGGGIGDSGGCGDGIDGGGIGGSGGGIGGGGDGGKGDDDDNNNNYNNNRRRIFIWGTCCL